MKIAGNALKANITTLGPLVLPISEQLLFFVNLVARKVGQRPVSLLPCRAGHFLGLSQSITGPCLP